jgi:hypothetical protein
LHTSSAHDELAPQATAEEHFELTGETGKSLVVTKATGTALEMPAAVRPQAGFGYPRVGLVRATDCGSYVSVVDFSMVPAVYRLQGCCAAARGGKREVIMADMSVGILVAVAAVLLFAATVLMLIMVLQLRAMRREVEATRLQLAKMDWGVMLLNGVQQLKQATVALEQIDKRLQKLEAIEKVQLSHINVRQGV